MTEQGPSGERGLPSGDGLSASIDRYFEISARGSTFTTEIRAGVTTFLTMGYILFINPQILSLAGMPEADVAIATALGAAIATIIMGLYANYPFVLAPGMGLNAYFTFGVVQGLGVSWQVALTAVFVEGLIFLALSRGGVRTLIINAIPGSLKIATTIGIGLFLAIIGLQNMQLVVDHPATLVSLGDVTQPSVYLALMGVLLIGALMVKRVKGAILIGILVITVISWVTGLAPAPERFVGLPSLPKETLFALDFSQIFSATFFTVVIAFMFVDIFDTAGTLIGVGRLAGFLDKDGKLPGSDRAFTADADRHVGGRSARHQHGHLLYRERHGRRGRRAHRLHLDRCRDHVPPGAVLHPAGDLGAGACHGARLDHRRHADDGRC